MGHRMAHRRPPLKATPVMTYLTRITLNPRSRTAGWDLTNRHGLHRSVMALIPHQHVECARQQAGVLYRLESDQHGHRLLVQSHDPLDTSRLPVGYASSVEERNLSALLDWLRPGCRIAYRCDASASVSIHSHGRRGKKRQISGPAAADWWQRKMAVAGLSDVMPDLIELPEVRMSKKLRDSRQSRSLRLTRLQGVATVTDAQALREAMCLGIGRDRSYGAGLLTVAALSAPE